MPTEAKTWKRVPPQGWNSDLNRQGVVAVHWLPEKFSGFPGTRVSPHLANGNPPGKGGQKAETGRQETGQWDKNKTSHAGYFPAHHPVRVMPSVKWEQCGVLRNVKIIEISADPLMAESRRLDRALRQPREDRLLALPGKSKRLLVVLSNWYREKRISHVMNYIPNARDCADLLQ